MDIELNRYIDHTLLKPDATEADIVKLCDEAKKYNFAAVCVNSCWIPVCRRELENSGVRICAVIGFPLGAVATEIKGFEAFEAAVKMGADEVDMVINIGKLKDGDDEYVKKEIKDCKYAIGHKILKVIIETCLLTDEEKVRACKDAMASDADFVKTSTGFSTGGATLEDVKLMKETVGDKCRVKAAGGVRSRADALAMIAAGAERIGTSRGVQLMEEEGKNLS